MLAMSSPSAPRVAAVVLPKPWGSLGVELVLCELAALTVELLAWGGSLWALRMTPGVVRIAGVVGATLAAAGAIRLFDVARPLMAVAARRERNELVPVNLGSPALNALVRLPGETAVLRFLTWLVVAVIAVGWLFVTGGISLAHGSQLLVAGVIHGSGAAALRGRLLEGRLRRLRPWLLPGTDGMRVYMEVYRRRMTRAGVLVLSGGHALWLWLVQSGLGLGAVTLVTWGWPILFVGAAFCVRSLRRRTLPIEAYFNVLYRSASTRGPARDEATAVPAFLAAQALPYRLAAYVAFILAAALLGAVAVGRWRLGYQPGEAARLLVAVFVVVFAAGGYALLLLRRTVAQFLRHLSSRHHLPLSQIRSPASVGLRLVVVFAAVGACLVGPWAISTSIVGGAVPWASACVGIALSLGLAWLVTSDTLRPLSALELRSEEMARGELARPVSPSGEADEIGRLTVAFEEMRRALRDRLRSTESINVDLEREVRRRTDALEKRNVELADALDKLKRAQDDLVRSEKLASMGRLVAGIAHEINNPVNAVINSLDPLGEQLDELERSRSEQETLALAKDAKDMLSVIRRGAARTKAIVRALHNYSRGDEHQFRSVDLVRIVGDTLDLLRHQLRDINITLDIPASCELQALPGQLDQVLMNLVVNAAQALNENAVANADATNSITIRAKQRIDQWYVTIADSGPGIPDHVLPKIFDPFFTTKVVGEGAGLGLSIVHGIVERHGGKLTVDSSAGKGTTFTMMLPMSQAE